MHLCVPLVRIDWGRLSNSDDKNRWDKLDETLNNMNNNCSLVPVVWWVYGNICKYSQTKASICKKKQYINSINKKNSITENFDWAITGVFDLFYVIYV